MGRAEYRPWIPKSDTPYLPSWLSVNSRHSEHGIFPENKPNIMLTDALTSHIAWTSAAMVSVYKVICFILWEWYLMIFAVSMLTDESYETYLCFFKHYIK